LERRQSSPSSIPRLRSNDHHFNLDPSSSFRLDELSNEQQLDWSEELFLSHFYITDTADTLSPDPATQNVWRNEVPLQARSHPFLMHGIVALAALHRTALYPQEKLGRVPMYEKHQQLAVSLMRKELQNITEENCNSIFPATVLVGIFCLYEFSIPTKHFHEDNREFDLANIVQLFTVIRGISDILRPIGPLVSSGPIQPLLHGYVVLPPPDFCLTKDVTSTLGRLRAFILDECSDEVYNSALQDTFEQIHSMYGEISYLYSSGRQPLDKGIFTKFLTWAPREFVTMLRDGEERALILFAFWIVLSAAVEQTWIVNESLGRSGIKILRRIVSPRLQPWLDWPEEQLRVKMRALIYEDED
jgi:hypothetical protein